MILSKKVLSQKHKIKDYYDIIGDTIYFCLVFNKQALQMITIIVYTELN